MSKLAQCFIPLLVGLTLVSPAAAEAGQAQYDWSGLYLGANFGLHDVETSGIFDGPELGVTPDLEGIGDEGAHLGIQGGYNLQIEQVVLGIEGDISLGGFNKSLSTIQDGSATEAGLFSYPIDGNLSYLASIRGRFGFDMEAMFHHPILLFVTGGVVFTDFEMDIANGRGEVGFSDTGPAWGAGFEIALSDRLSLRAEYLHMDFDKRLDIADEAISGIFDANDGNFVKLKNLDMIRVGFDFLIGGP